MTQLKIQNAKTIQNDKYHETTNKMTLKYEQIFKYKK